MTKYLSDLMFDANKHSFQVEITKEGVITILTPNYFPTNHIKLTDKNHADINNLKEYVLNSQKPVPIMG